MCWKSALITLVLAVTLSGTAFADELTQIVQQDLTALGYDTGGTDGKCGP